MKLFLAASAYVLISVSAHASPGEKRLSLGGGLSLLDAESRIPGAGFNGMFEWGVSEAFSLTGTLHLGGHYRSEFAGIGGATVGATYVIDVLKYVPYFSVGGGVLLATDENFSTHLQPTISAQLGIDWLDRTTHWGVYVQALSFAGEYSVFSTGVRWGWRWGFF